MAGPLQRLVMEVERKFVCDTRIADRIRQNNGQPPFRSLQCEGRKDFHDSYYDLNGTLSRRGIWVRKRDGEWQAKARQGGDYTNSQFSEVKGEEAVRKYTYQSTFHWHNSNHQKRLV